MAGAGYKLFNTGDVLTAQQVNEYLMQQTVMVFANASARTTALSGVLAEGMVSYLQDQDKMYVYNGSAWIDASSELPSQTGNSGKYLTTDGSTASWGTVSGGGETLLATHTADNTVMSYTTSSIPSTYKHLMVIGSGIQLNDTVKRDLTFKFNGSTGSDYYIDYLYWDGGSATAANFTGQAAMYFSTNGTASVGGSSTATSDAWGNFAFYVYDYASSLYKSCIFEGGRKYSVVTGRGLWNQTNAITSITVGSNVNFKAGTIKIYGVS